jgi:hypothetical protein
MNQKGKDVANLFGSLHLLQAIKHGRDFHWCQLLADICKMDNIFGPQVVTNRQ